MRYACIIYANIDAPLSEIQIKFLSPNRYIKQCLSYINSIHRNKRQWMLNQDTFICIPKTVLENIFLNNSHVLQASVS